MNKVILVGNLTRDPEVRYSQGANQMAVARFSIAVNRKFKRDGEPDADFFNCTSFGKQAEFVEKYLHKGRKVAVSGRIQNDNYTNKDGQMVYSVRIMVEDVEIAELKGSSDGGYNNGGYNNGGYNNAGGYNGGGYAGGNGAPQASGAGDGFMNIPDGIDEELPFN